MAIFITGDVHGPRGILNRFNKDNFPQQTELNRSDVMVIAGDFGGIWSTNTRSFSEDREETYVLDWLNRKSFTTLIVPGNHENYDRIFGIQDMKLLNSWFYKNMPTEEKEKLKLGYPKTTWNGGSVRCLRSHVFVAEHGSIFNISGKTVFTFGGAQSHDIEDGILVPYEYDNNYEFSKKYKCVRQYSRHFRVKGTSWWSQEIPSGLDMEHGQTNLNKVQNTVDYIVTHEAPSSCHIQLGYLEPNPLSIYLENVKQSTTYKKWFFGHYHEDKALPGNSEIVIFNNIEQVCF